MTHPSSVSKRSALKRVSFREWLVAVSGGLTLAFTAWGLGGIPAWTLHVLLAGGAVTLILALFNFNVSAFPYLSISTESLKRLARWPFFWFSLAFLLYLLIGALNPGLQIVRNERGWWVEAMQPQLAAWLPISVTSDYQPMNAWRVLVSFTASFALAWGLWAGLTRRAPVLLVLWLLLISGAGMALVGILQHLSDANAVLWTFPSSNPQFWGSFFYRNQGAAYLNVILVLAGFLFFYHGVKTRQRLRSGGPHFLCFLLFALTAASVGLALSRGGILFACILSAAFVVLLGVFLLQGIFQMSSVWTTLTPVVLLTAGAFLSVQYIDLDAIEKRFGDIEATIETADQDVRAISSKATWDMAQDRLILGWGAGSFRYIFPMYQRNYPEIFYRYYHKRNQQWVGRKMYHYAHNDILQFLAEYGVIGCSLLFLALGSVFLTILKNAVHWPLASLLLLVGIAQALAHACLDFIFNSPAYWMAFISLLVVSTRLLCLEQERRAKQ